VFLLQQIEKHIVEEKILDGPPCTNYCITMLWWSHHYCMNTIGLEYTSEFLYCVINLHCMIDVSDYILWS